MFYSDSRPHVFARVERPQLSFGMYDEETGFFDEPKVLYNGVVRMAPDYMSAPPWIRCQILWIKSESSSDIFHSF